MAVSRRDKADFFTKKAHSEGYPAGELKHGTLSLVDENSLVIAIITQSEILDKTLNAVHEVRARGAKVKYGA